MIPIDDAHQSVQNALRERAVEDIAQDFIMGKKVCGLTIDNMLEDYLESDPSKVVHIMVLAVSLDPYDATVEVEKMIRASIRASKRLEMEIDDRKAEIDQDMKEAARG